MYITPVIYPLSAIPPQFKAFIEYNPIAPIIEAFRYGFTNHGQFNLGDLGYSAVCMFVLLFVGIILFNKTEKTFMDTV